MKDPRLTVRKLLDAGFDEVGCWELNDARDLSHSIDLPREAGVYAFAIDDVVQYVGLASKSLRQRLGFYRKPGVSQRTNIRLNDVIRGEISKGVIVRILIAHPPDQEWNGFKISGAEGLEAGIISDFQLPWNIRGNVSPTIVANDRKGVATQSSRADRVLTLVRQKPGMTGGEIAQALYGPQGTQPQINSVLHDLMDAGLIERLIVGGYRPYRYFPKD